jgi:hypothetical protein
VDSGNPAVEFKWIVQAVLKVFNPAVEF